MFDRKWGSPGSGNGQFTPGDGISLLGPTGLATDAAGNVYVADASAYRIQKFSATGTFITKWGSQGSGNGQFEGQPSAIETDSSGNVYVAAPSGCCSSRIQKFSPAGSFMQGWTTEFWVRGLATDSSANVYAVAGSRSSGRGPSLWARLALASAWGERSGVAP